MLPRDVGSAVVVDIDVEQHRVAADRAVFDVIRMFGDQLIVSNEQLTTLVKAAGAGTKVPLKVLRGGRERVVEAVLAEHEVPVDGDWTVSFLYCKAYMGQVGNDGQAKVIDSPAIVVVSIGMKGGYGSGVVQEGLEALQRWFEGQDAWEPAGDPRSLMYNGPGAPFGQPWSEVQVPVRRKPQAGVAKP